MQTSQLTPLQSATRRELQKTLLHAAATGGKSARRSEHVGTASYENMHVPGRDTDGAISHKDANEALESTLPGPALAEQAAAAAYIARGFQASQAPLSSSSANTKSAGPTKSERGVYVSHSSNQNDLDKYIQEIEQNRSRIAELEGQQEQLQETLRRIQVHAFKRFDPPCWSPQSNDDISRKLDRLDDTAKSWAKRNSIMDMSSLDTPRLPKTSKKLLEAFDGFAHPTEGMILMGLPHDKAWVLIQSFILHHVYNDVFNEPFFGLDNCSDVSVSINSGERRSLSERNLKKFSSKSGVGFETPLQMLYEDFVKCDEQEAVAWRVQTLRMLNPPPIQEKGMMNAHKRALFDSTAKGRRDVAEILARRYLKSGIRALIKYPGKESTVMSLCTLIEEAADVSLYLRTQKFYLQCRHLKHRAIGDTFSHGNEMIEPHQLQRKYVDEDPAYLDGAKILIVTHPALIRYGNEDATEFGVHTILKRAKCWVTPPTDSSR